MADKPYAKGHGFITRLLERLIVNHFRRVNQTTEWHRLSKWRALLNLLAFRIELREHNLYDTDGDLTKPKPNCPFHPNPPARTMRTASGTQNDLQYPAMGCRGSRPGVSSRPCGHLCLRRAEGSCPPRAWEYFSVQAGVAG